MSARNLISPESLQGIQEAPTAPFDSQSSGRPKRVSLAQIAIPSFSSFKNRASSIPTSSPVRRKPLPKTASSIAISYARTSSASSATLYNQASAEYSFSDSPLLPPITSLSNVSAPPLPAEYEDFHPQEYYSNEHILPGTHDRAVSTDSRITGSGVAIKRLSGVDPRPASIPVPFRYGDKDDFSRGHVATPSVTSFVTTSDLTSPPSSHRRSRSSVMSATSPIQPPAMTVQLDGIDRIPRSFTDESVESYGSTSPAKRRSKSPGSKLTSFFGWKPSSQQGEGNSPTTTFSDRSASPIPSPMLHTRDHFDGRPASMGLSPPALDIHRANTNAQSLYFDVPGTPLLSGSSSVNAHVEELERELRQVSSELAGSIRREMELEDEVERFRMEMSSFSQDQSLEPTRRGSDYFSDSGTSSLRFPLGDSDAKIEELERIRRKCEQDKAQLQVDYAQKLAQELRHRKDLEAQLHELTEELQSREVDASEEPISDGRVRELETYLDDARRRLSQERQAKDNFEDMFAALREESGKYRNERDNLHDEIIPQMKARIEGLEAETNEMRSAQYEQSRLQQDLQALQVENKKLKEALSNPANFNTIAEDEAMPVNKWPRAGLSRSNSLARSSSHQNLRRGSSLTRTGSVKEPREATRSRSDSVSNERLKDVEEQRDALHKALKNLLRRFENQKREHAKAMRRLIADRDRARSATPARMGFSREVQYLREEIGTLRRRADDALEHKWQAENNIGGVKMALDRAEQETRSLRHYLAGRHSGLIRSAPRRSVVGGLGITMSDEEPELGEDERQAMIKVLRQSIQLAETERDAALREAEAYRERARSLQDLEHENVGQEEEIAAELLAAAARMEDLAAQVQKHLQSNMELRERLTVAVSKGERQQLDSTARITEMQSRLKEMEDNVLQAQHQSESALGNHEEEAKKLEEANSPHLARLHTALHGSQNQSPIMRSPLAQGRFAKSPKMGQGAGAQAATLFEATKTEVLERRVRELEAALSDADSEMTEVVQRINNSQYEIAELQGERDDAQRVMRRLQKEISEEKEKVQELLGSS